MNASHKSNPSSVELKWNLMAHGEAREEKWRGKRRMEWVASTHALYGNTVYPALLPLMRTPRLPAADWTDTPADINGLVRFAGRPNLVSARVPSHSVSTLPRVIVDSYSTLPWVTWEAVTVVEGIPWWGLLRHTLAIGAVVYPSQGGRYHAEGCVVLG